MTDAERTLLLAVAKALAVGRPLDWQLIRAVERERDVIVRERLDEAIARGRMIAAAID